MFISIHNNATDQSTKKNGTSVLYNPGENDTYSSKTFAKICLDNLIAQLGSKNLGLVKGDYVYIVKNSEVPVALLEIGYMSNKSELKKLRDAAYQKKVAKAIYKSILEAIEKGF